jgi:hypothetical protein
MTAPFLDEVLGVFPEDATPARADDLAITGVGELPSWFAVTDLAAATVGAAGLMLGRLAGVPKITVDKRLASIWFDWSLRPDGWETPPVWDPIAGIYHTKDGLIRLHTNAAHHRAAALAVLGPHQDRDAVAGAVEHWDGSELEAAIVAAGGCAAQMRDLESWAAHPQGAAIAAEPLIQWLDHPSVDATPVPANPARPLDGIKVLDLTRVLAGPVAGRFLAGYGAELLRIDPPHWEEPGVVPEVSLGKRRAGLDLKNPEDHAVLVELLREADILLHGYRNGAMGGLGFDPASLRAINPGLIDVSLCAYGWTGPWSQRRGFDSLVQMSCGIADFGKQQTGANTAVPLPVQALDHATGYLMAAAALHALQARQQTGAVRTARLSLSRTAHLLIPSQRRVSGPGMVEAAEADIDPRIENTDWGPARRVNFPLSIDGITPHWRYPAGNLRTSEARW